MTDAVPIEEPVPPVPPPPEATAELDVVPPQAGAALEVAPASAELEAPPEAPHGSRLPFDVEHLGPLRRAVLDALVDADEPLNVSRILAEMPAGTTRGSAESAIKREFDAGRIERVAPGVYRLAPPKPPKQSRPAPQPTPLPEDEAVWFARLEAWVVDPSSWDVEAFGPLPNVPNNIPPEIKAKFIDRLRKRRERYRGAEAAAAKRTAADAELRGQLIAATGGNIVRGVGVDDVSPIRAAMELVPLDCILSAIRYKTDRKLYPKNEPARSWSADRLLKAIAENYCAAVMIPSMVAAWSKAGKAPSPAVASSPPDADMPDDTDELRRRHDSEHEPAGPHVMPQPDAAPSAPNAPQKPASASEAPTAVRGIPRTGKRISGAPRAARRSPRERCGACNH